MATSYHGNVFRITSLCEGNPSVNRGIPSQTATNAEHWCLLCFYPEQAVEQNDPVFGDLKRHDAQMTLLERYMNCMEHRYKSAS